MRTAEKKRTKKAQMTRPCVEINVEDLRKGDEIVTVFARQGKAQLKKTFAHRTAEEALEDFVTENGQRKAIKAEKVDEIVECPGKWRTHVHVNKRMCYDMRGKVWVVVK